MASPYPFYPNMKYMYMRERERERDREREKRERITKKIKQR